MNDFNRALDMYLSHFNKMFWLFFALAGTVFIVSVLLGFVSLLYLDILLGIVLIFTGIHRLGEEFYNRKLKNTQDDSIRAINEILQWAEKSYDYTRSFKDLHERRIYRLDQKRAKHEKTVEVQFRDAVRKIIEMENKLNKNMRSLDQEKQLISRLDRMAREILRERRFVERRLLDLSTIQLKVLQLLRKTGKMTNKEFRTRFRVSDKKAYNELMALMQKGLIKRMGKGRSTHYVLAF